MAACSTTWPTWPFAAAPQAAPTPPLLLTQPVDLERFSGDWYVIASIPTPWEAGAYDAKETYRLKPDGTVDTTLNFRSGSADGPLHTYHSVAYMKGTGNPVWGQHYLWPLDMMPAFEADYRIAYLSPDYSQVVIARGSRDYVWIMARTPKIADADYRSLLGFASRIGYDATQVQRVPQSGAL